MNKSSGILQEHECFILKEYNMRSKNSEIAIQKLSDNCWYWVRYDDKKGNIADGIGYCPYCGAKLN